MHVIESLDGTASGGLMERVALSEDFSKQRRHGGFSGNRIPGQQHGRYKGTGAGQCVGRFEFQHVGQYGWSQKGRWENEEMDSGSIS